MAEFFTPFDESFLKKYPLVNFHKGDILIKYDQVNRYLFSIKEGICACSILHTDGNTIVPLFLRKGEVIGIRLEVLGAKENRSIHEVVAQTDVTAYKIPREDVQQLLSKDFEAYRRAACSVITSLDILADTSNMRGRGNSVMMVCNTIMREMEGVPDHPDLYRIPHYLTVTDLASSLLIHRITVSRIMHSLCDEGVLKKEGTTWFILNKNLLDKYRQGILTLKIRK